MERVMGIEPTSSAWKAEVLPLNYTRLNGFHTSRRPIQLLRNASANSSDISRAIDLKRFSKLPFSIALSHR